MELENKGDKYVQGAFTRHRLSSEYNDVTTLLQTGGEILL